MLHLEAPESQRFSGTTSKFVFGKAVRLCRQCTMHYREQLAVDELTLGGA